MDDGDLQLSVLVMAADGKGWLVENNEPVWVYKGSSAVIKKRTKHSALLQYITYLGMVYQIVLLKIHCASSSNCHSQPS